MIQRSPRVDVSVENIKTGRSAYTLTEVMIVLAILAAIAGLSWPALMRPWSRSVVKQSAQELIEQLSEARRRAVAESRVYRMRWQPGTNRFEIVCPDQPAGLPGDAAMGTEGRSAQSIRQMESGTARSAGNVSPTGANVADSSGRFGESAASDLVMAAPWELQGELENGVRFEKPSTSANSLGTTVDQAAERSLPDSPSEPKLDDPLTSIATESNDVAWSEPVWFYPDGRTTTAEWTLTSEDNHEVTVFLRGLTGLARAGAVRQAANDPSVLDPQSTSAETIGSTNPRSPQVEAGRQVPPRGGTP